MDEVRDDALMNENEEELDETEAGIEEDAELDADLIEDEVEEDDEFDSVSSEE